MTTINRRDLFEWAANHKAEVFDLAQKYSGSFVRRMIEAFIHADAINTRKMIEMWSEYFESLYEMRSKENNR